MKKLVAIALSGIFNIAIAQQPAGTANYPAAESGAKVIHTRTGQALAARLSVASGNFKVNLYRCAWEVDPVIRYIKGSVTSYFTITAATSSITFDMHSALKVDSVRFRNQPVSFQHTSGHALVIQLPQTLAVQQKDSVAIFYQGVPVNNGQGSFVTSLQNGTPLMWSLSEPYGAMDWWPCKNATADKADSLDIQITYPAQYSSSSNGLLTAQTTSNGKKTDYWKHRYPIAAYLVAFAVTNYDIDNDSVQIGNVMLPVRMYAYATQAANYKAATFFAKQCLPKFSELFGPYPFIRESYSQTQFGVGGGMEHQTNTFIGSIWNQLTAHELGHQWFGDKVTCNSWQDIWLNEGFATYIQALYVENFEPADLQAHIFMLRNSVVSAPGGAVKVADTTRVERIFDSRLSYNKGAYLVHMIRWRLGDALFFAALRNYLNDPQLAYRSAGTPDLQKHLEQVSGQSFTRFFKQWYEGEGFPSYQVQWAQTDRQQVTIRLSQTTSHPSVPFYEMPVPVRFRGAVNDTTVVLAHTSNNQQFVVNLSFAADSAIFDPKAWILSANNSVTRVAVIPVNTNDARAYYDPRRGSFFFSIKNPSGNRLDLQLVSAAGQRVYTKEITLNGSDVLLEIPAAHLSAGIYFLSARGGGVRMVKKIMK